MPTLMHCAPQTQIPWNLSYSKLLIVVKGFISKIWYPTEQHRLSVQKNCHPFERLWLSVRKRNVICLNDSGYLLERNFHPFDWLGLSSIHLKKTVIHLNSSSYPFKTLLSAVLLFQSTFTWAICDIHKPVKKCKLK